MPRNGFTLSIWKHRLFLTVLSGVLLLPVVPSALAQYSETTGTIQGVVKDPTGAVVPNATVEISSATLIGTQKQQSDHAGYYRFANLPPGDYAIVVTASGFSQFKQTGIKLEVGKRLTIDFDLQVGAVAQTVEVQAAPLIVDTTSSKAAVNLAIDVINYIPKGRSFENLITLAPGAREEPLQGGARGDARGVGAGFQIDGASDSENSYSVEGMDTSRLVGGGFGLNVPFEFVQEVQIKSSGFEAEHGGALGGVVNVVTKRGGNTWHGSGVFYYRSDALQASDRPGLRLDPQARIDRPRRLSEPPQYYQAKEDRWRTLEPGFDLGGYILKDRLWVFASYIPSLFRQSRTVNFNYRNLLNQPISTTRTFLTTDNTHFALGRLDWRATDKIRANFSWNYAYRRTAGDPFLGALPSADSVYGQFNASSESDPAQFRGELGRVLPNTSYTAGADFTISPKLVVTTRFGFWTTNIRDRGKPIGNRYSYSRSGIGLRALDGTTVLPSQFQFGTGFQTQTDIRNTFFDVQNRTGFNVDTSYVTHWLGSHALKGGFGLNRLSNDVDFHPQGGEVFLFWGQDYRPLINLPAQGGVNCTAIEAFNRARGLPARCQGLWGVYLIRHFERKGKVSSNNYALYLQDSWTVGKGVTLNLGVRFDKEFLPSFVPFSGAASRPIDFGFGDKVAPRLGAAWDVFRNGKLKLYGSWGLFYDIMKYELPRGSFGGEWWHDCWYTLDVADYTMINPTPNAQGRFCRPASGLAPGSIFIEEPDWRVPANDPRDNRIAPGIKPMRQREMVLGAEYALRPNLGLEIRYARKRLDRTIEDVGFLDPNVGETYFIANPGEGVVLNPLRGICATCPNQPKAVRNYDGVEFRVTKRWSGNWFAAASYTYSRSFGNYSGLTSTFESGRHSPNVNRFFDLPHMTFTATGTPSMGLLPTDRPHTFKFYGAYRLKWWGMESTFGLTQLAYSGTPITTEVPVITSTRMDVVGRSNFQPATRDAAGNFVGQPVKNVFRTAAFTNTDFVFAHEFKVSKTNEALRAAFEINVTNLFNQNNVLRIHNNPLREGQLNFIDPRTDDIDWARVFRGFDWIARANTLDRPTGAILRTLDSRYGLSDLFQGPRSLRLKLKFSF